MFSPFTDFMMNGLIRLILKLPVNPFTLSSSDYTNFNTIFSYVNYFVPFYRLSFLFNAWLGMVTVSAAVFILVKFVLKRSIG